MSELQRVNHNTGILTRLGTQQNKMRDRGHRCDKKKKRKQRILGKKELTDAPIKSRGQERKRR